MQEVDKSDSTQYCFPALTYLCILDNWKYFFNNIKLFLMSVLFIDVLQIYSK